MPVTFGGDQVTFSNDNVVFNDVTAYPPVSPGTSPFELIWNGTEIGAWEWTASGEEVVGGIGRATVRVQDRGDSLWEPEPHTEVVIRIRASGWVLFHGESLTCSVDLPPGMPIRIWTITCRDYNAQLAERLVGAPDGSQFWRPNDREEFRAIDPSAVSGGDDEDTVKDWLDAYFRFPDGTAPDTTTHVHEYIPNSVLGQAEYIMWLYDAMTTLQSALESLAAMADVNIQFWLCPDDHFHWVAIPSWRDLFNTDPTDLEDAPYRLMDLALLPDGTTEMGHGGIRLDKDGQTMPEKLYAQGATGYVRDDFTGLAADAGSGWVPGPPARTERQAYLSIPDAWERTRRDTVATAALNRAFRPTYRATVVIIGWHGEPRDGWRAGQLLTLEDPRVPGSMRPVGRFPIQSLAWSLVPGTALVRYEAGIGDGTVSRISQRQRNVIEKVGPAAKKPIITWAGIWVDANGAEDLRPIGAGETRNVIADTRNALGEQWAPAGFPVTFVVEAYDSDENIVPLMGSFSPNPTVTDQDGIARSVFTAGATEGLDYVVFAETEIAP